VPVLPAAPDRDTMMYLPSGVHSGDQYRVFLPLVSGRGFEPSPLAIHTFSSPLRSERNTILVPSGAYRGWLSNITPEVIRRASPPAIGKV
jgi:hypothetical protein